MRDRLKMKRVRLCLMVAAVLLTGCPAERDSARQGGPAPSDRQTAGDAGPATDQNDGQRLGYVPAEPAKTGDRGGQDLSDKEVAVGMTNRLRYAPEEVTITAGQTVVWTNNSSLIHTVTADPSLANDPSHVRLPEGAQAFDSGNMAPGATFRHTFDVPGQYVYFCIPHEAAGMVGKVNVREKQ